MAKFDSAFDSHKHDWETPDWLFALLDEEFGFTIDICASHHNFKCVPYITEEENALEMDWDGIVWMNPPFKDIKTWVKKALEESRKGAIVVCLVKARTNTNWWHDYCMKAKEIRFLQGRVRFAGAKYGLPQPLAIVIFDRLDATPIATSFDIRGKDAR